MTKQQILDELSKATTQLSPANHKSNSQYISEVLEVQRNLIRLEQRIENDIQFDELAEKAFALKQMNPEAYEQVLADFANGN